MYKIFSQSVKMTSVKSVNNLSSTNGANTLLLMFTTVVFIWYLQILWGRRKLYLQSIKVDGPIGFPIIGAAHHFITSPNVMETLIDMADKYNGFYCVWLGHKLKYFITRPEHVDILLNHPNAIGKEEIYELFECAVGQGLVTARAENWKKQRKIVSGFLGQQNLQAYIDGTSKYTQLTINSIKERLAKNEHIEVELEITSTTLDNVFETLFGTRPKQVTPEFNKNFIERIMDSLWLRAFMIHYQIDFIFNMSSEGKKTNTLINKYVKMISSIIEMKHQEYSQNKALIENEQSTVIGYLMDKYGDSKRAIMDKKIQDEIFTFIVAGSDTTSTSASFALVALGLHQDIQKKVYEEIMDIIGDSNNFDAKNLNQLKYLDRVLKESARLFPIVPFIGRRILGDIDLKDGNTIPEGAGIIVCILYMQRCAKYWPDPLKFDPDRFLPENVVKRQRSTYMPFSYGPRNCVGMTYGTMALKTIIALMVKNFIIKTDYKCIEDVKLNVNIVLRPKNGYNIKLEPRK